MSWGAEIHYVRGQDARETSSALFSQHLVSTKNRTNIPRKIFINEIQDPFYVYLTILQLAWIILWLTMKK